MDEEIMVSKRSLVALLGYAVICGVSLWMLINGAYIYFVVLAVVSMVPFWICISDFIKAKKEAQLEEEEEGVDLKEGLLEDYSDSVKVSPSALPRMVTKGSSVAMAFMLVMLFLGCIVVLDIFINACKASAEGRGWEMRGLYRYFILFGVNSTLPFWICIYDWLKGKNKTPDDLNLDDFF